MASPKQSTVVAMHLLLDVLLLYNGVNNVHCSKIRENSVDLHALLDFKQRTIDPNGALGNWSTNTHLCRWNGVRCTLKRPFRVLSLNLTKLNLGGQITSSLGNLTFLQVFDLSSSNFFGPLPILGHLQHLQVFYLNNNNLTGIIPDALTNCSKLQYIDISNNFLNGAIPPKLGFLLDLEYVNFKLNQLEGRIPIELGQLAKLQFLHIGQNRLSGEIQHDNFILSTSLEVISLELNMLGKALPSNIGDLLPNLKKMYLDNNTFEGPIPTSLGNALMLEVLDLSANKFSGPIPTSLGKLSRLLFLNLEFNQLEARSHKDWEFLNALANCTSLQVLSLSTNQLQGYIPQSIGNLATSLNHLYLACNNLSGQVPKSIGKYSSLIILSLGKNNLSGTIEGWIGNLKLLQVLGLESNHFTGLIPSSISNLTRLSYLYLSKNEFAGLIPASLESLPLSYLDLSYNNLQGHIPPNLGNLQDLITLNLSHNNLQGDIPEISKLTHLIYLDLSSNKLTGQIPGSLGQCNGLVILQMDQNFLSGNIPKTFGNLLSLSRLNLSHNNLSGTIPSVLNEIKYLIDLDLSYNDLQGEIPKDGVFRNATAVSLQGNPGLCGGVADLRMPSCPMDFKSTQRRRLLIEALIPVFIFMSLLFLVYFVIPEKRKMTNDSKKFSGENFIKVSYNDLAQATSKFSKSNLIGGGGYGSVYRGKLQLQESMEEVVVKVFNLDMHGAKKSFLKECEVLRSIQHRNILPIITACSSVDNKGNAFKALVYEFMPNGSLDSWLHHAGDGETRQHLRLGQRLSIAVDIADALDYVHHDCGRPIVHCDVKPSNIILDDDMNALLGDFGIASFFPESCSETSSSITSSVGVKGTIGYIAPEYAVGGRRASTSGDVFGFGVLMVEMMTGRRPTDPMFDDGVSIVDFVASHFPHEIILIVDDILRQECKDCSEVEKVSQNSVHRCLVSLLQIALWCARPIPCERMNMNEVAIKMHAIKTSYMGKKTQRCPLY